MPAPKRYVEEPARQFPRAFLDDKPFSQALSAFIVVCTDFVPVNVAERKIYLAKRRIQAAQGIWRFGGRQLPGETMQSSCSRLAKREMGLELPPADFRWFLQTEDLFSYRAQEPVEAGVHDLINIFHISLSEVELRYAQLHLDSKEYDVAFGIRPYRRAELVKGVAGGSIRPQLLDMYDVLFPR